MGDGNLSMPHGGQPESPVVAELHWSPGASPGVQARCTSRRRRAETEGPELGPPYGVAIEQVPLTASTLPTASRCSLGKRRYCHRASGRARCIAIGLRLLQTERRRWVHAAARDGHEPDSEWSCAASARASARSFSEPRRRAHEDRCLLNRDHLEPHLGVPRVVRMQTTH